MNDETKPDVRVTPGEPYPFDDNFFDAVYLGHVLEHIPWKDVPSFLNDISRVAKPNAPILVVGPDVYKTIHRWKQDREPWFMVQSVLEHQGMNPKTEHSEWWDGASHHWNCHEERVEELLTSMGFVGVTNVFDQIPDDPSGKSWYDPLNGITWPVVGKYYWQLALLMRNK